MLNKKRLGAILLSFLMIFTGMAQMVSAYTEDNTMTNVNCSIQHQDNAYSWNQRQTVNDIVDSTLPGGISAMNNIPAFHWSIENAFGLSLIKRYAPSGFSTLQSLFSSGQFKTNGIQWLHGDMYVPIFETKVRDLNFGKNFYESNFNNYRPKVYYQQDTFCGGWYLPQLVKGADLLGTNNSFNRAEQPDNTLYWYTGADGSRVFSQYQNYYYQSSNPGDALQQSLQYGIKSAFFLAGIGDTGKVPDQAKITAFLNGGKASDPVRKFMGLDEFYETYRSQTEMNKVTASFSGPMDRIHEVDGQIHRGSVPELKKAYRDSESSLENSERLANIATWLGARTYDTAKLNQAWRRVIENTGHDVIPGTTVDSATTIAMGDAKIAQNLSDKDMAYSIKAISERADTTGAGKPIVVHNSMAFSRDDVVETDVAFDSAPAAVKLTDTVTGSEIPVQVLSISGNVAKIVFVAQNVPSMGFKVYRAEAASSGASNTGLSASGNVLESSKFRVEINGTTGNISRILDKVNNKEIVKSGSEIQWQKLADPGGAVVRDSTKLANLHSAAPAIVNDSPVITLLENGPVRARYSIAKTNGNSKYNQVVTVYYNLNRVDIKCNLVNNDSANFVKLAFPLSFTAPKAAYDYNAAVFEVASNNIDEAANRFADMTNSDKSYGVSIINNGIYGYDTPSTDTIRATVGRSVAGTDGSNLSHFCENTVDFGVYPHTGSWTNGTNIAAAAFNSPLKAYQDTSHSGNIGRSFSFVTVNQPNVEVTALKKAENSNEMIIRLHECNGVDSTNATVTFNGNITSLNECNLLEDNKGSVPYNGSSFTIPLTKFQYRSFKVTLSSLYSQNTLPTTSKVNLSTYFNNDGISDMTSRQGNMDGSGNSLPSEELTSEVKINDIPFTVGDTSGTNNNLVKTTGQTITLTGGNYKRLYMLGFSTDTMAASGTFTVNYSDNSKTSNNIIFSKVLLGNKDQANSSVGADYSSNVSNMSTIGKLFDCYYNTSTVNREYESFAYVYAIDLDSSKTVASITLPNNNDIELMGITLANGQNLFDAPSGIQDNNGSGPLVNGALYKIVNLSNQKLAEVDGGSTADGAAVTQLTDNGAGYQQWQAVDVGNSTYKFVNRMSGKPMVVNGGSTADGATIIQWTDNGHADQMWVVTDAGGGNYKISNKNSGKLMVVNGGSTADGAALIQWTDNGHSDQKWSFVKVNPPAGPLVSGAYYKIKNLNSQKLAVVDHASTSDSAAVIQWTDNGASDQQWQAVFYGNSTYKFVNRNSGKLLVVNGGSTADGATIIQYPDNGHSDQMWVVIDAGSGNYKISNKNSGKLIVVNKGSTDDGAGIIQWTDNGHSDQEWSFVQVN